LSGNRLTFDRGQQKRDKKRDPNFIFCIFC